MWGLLFIILGLLLSITSAQANYMDANGNKIFARNVPNDFRSGRQKIYSKYGAVTIVAAKHAERFQGFIVELEEHYGAKIYDMGGIRKGHCRPGGMHPCGRALDLCQLRRGVVDRKCNLPPPVTLARIAHEHGLFEGGLWCNSDYGHVQVGISSPECRGVVLTAKRKNKTRYAKNKHYKIRYAHAR